ncbi:unnamed protein product [Trifolium pratense]|uniref:Uncharacterized protein n=1 Tax=Trifolium pratense TaxID=57577 RepID=A0ACB0JMH1_TRIPR|nr:unnamed protein product [Trifolium pratense]
MPTYYEDLNTILGRRMQKTIMYTIHVKDVFLNQSLGEYITSFHDYLVLEGPVAEPVLTQIIKSRGPNQSTRYEVDVWQQFCLDNYFSNGDVVKFTFFDLENSNRVDVDRVIQDVDRVIQ